MPVDKCKFGVFKGITVHMLYYYYDYYHHRRFVFGFLLKSHIWEREESRQSADCFCSQQHKRERDCSDELHEHQRHLTCSLPSECFHSSRRLQLLVVNRNSSCDLFVSAVTRLPLKKHEFYPAEHQSFCSTAASVCQWVCVVVWLRYFKRLVQIHWSHTATQSN